MNAPTTLRMVSVFVAPDSWKGCDACCCAAADIWARICMRCARSAANTSEVSGWGGTWVGLEGCGGRGASRKRDLAGRGGLSWGKGG